MSNTAKKNQVDLLIERIQSNPNFALIRFDKTSHKALEELRRQLQKSDSKLRVIKNTLFIKAVNKLIASQKEYKNLKEKGTTIKDNSGLLSLGQDWNQGLKAFNDFSKKDPTLSFKLGYLDNVVYMGQELQRIAQLPSRNELIAKVIGGMKSPLYGFNYALKYNMQKFVYILSQKSQQS